MQHHVDADVVLLYAADKTSCSALSWEHVISACPKHGQSIRTKTRKALVYIGVISQKDTKQIEKHKPKVKMHSRNLALQWPVRPWCHVWQSFRAQLCPALIKEFPWQGRKENDCQTLNSESSSIWFRSNPQDRSDFAADTLVHFCPKPFSCRPVVSGFKMFRKQNWAKLSEEFHSPGFRITPKKGA